MAKKALQLTTKVPLLDHESTLKSFSNSNNLFLLSNYRYYYANNLRQVKWLNEYITSSLKHQKETLDHKVTISENYKNGQFFQRF